MKKQSRKREHGKVPTKFIVENGERPVAGRTGDGIPVPFLLRKGEQRTSKLFLPFSH